MISEDYIREWQREAPWPFLNQVEQDLIISRALVELYRQPVLRKTLAFRGGTALHKLFIRPAARHSEDLDFVQIRPEPIGETFQAIQKALDHWLGVPCWEKKPGRFTLRYKFMPEKEEFFMKLKIEINTAEHFSIDGFQEHPYEVNSRWFEGSTDIVTFSLEELVGTKIRALYQRKKGRDLFDLWLILKQKKCDIGHAVSIFEEYLSREGSKVSRAQFEKNLFAKLHDKAFASDITPLLSPQMEWDFDEAQNLVMDHICTKLPGDPWKNRTS